MRKPHQIKNFITSTPLILLSMAIIALSSCKDKSKSMSTTPKTSTPEQVLQKYPRTYESADNGNQESSVSPYSLGDRPKLLKSLEVQFHKHIASHKSDGITKFGIQKSTDTSMLIKFSPNSTGDSKTITAIWKRQEKEPTTGEAIFVERHSDPLDSEEEALILLKSYSSLDPKFESLTNWTVKGSKMSLPNN